MAEFIYNPSLEVNDITVTYNNGHTAIYDASFSLSAGTICALVGVNGSGKSTLFKSIMGFVKPIKGSVTLSGMPVLTALKQNIVSYVPQAEDVDWNFPVLVEDVVMMGRFGHMNFMRIPKKKDKLAVSDALEKVGMTEYSKRQIGELSGGQKKRVFLARSIAQEGQIILLDEPFTGVDVQTELAIMKLLKQMRDEGRLMLVATHNLGSIPDFCDHTVMLNRTILDAGKTADVFTPENLEKTFGGVLRHFTLGGDELHDDDDARSVRVITDDERPLVLYGNKTQKSAAAKNSSPSNKPDADTETTTPKVEAK